MRKYWREQDEAHRLWKASEIKTHRMKAIADKVGTPNREIMNKGYWYNFSTEIRREIGNPPKKKGIERDNWVRKVHNFMADKLEANLTFDESYTSFVVTFI